MFDTAGRHGGPPGDTVDRLRAAFSEAEEELSLNHLNCHHGAGGLSYIVRKAFRGVLSASEIFESPYWGGGGTVKKSKVAER